MVGSASRVIPSCRSAPSDIQGARPGPMEQAETIWNALGTGDCIVMNLLPGIRELWAETLGDPTVCIAVLDGPVDLSHPSLIGANLTQGETMVPGTADLGPACRHGTHIASVIFGRHYGPVAGLAPRCRGVLLPIFRSVGEQSFQPCSQLDLARAITQAVQQGAHVINISGGQFSPSGTAHPLLADVVRD